MHGHQCHDYNMRITTIAISISSRSYGMLTTTTTTTAAAATTTTTTATTTTTTTATTTTTTTTTTTITTTTTTNNNDTNSSNDNKLCYVCLDTDLEVRRHALRRLPGEVRVHGLIILLLLRLLLVVVLLVVLVFLARRTPHGVLTTIPPTIMAGEVRVHGRQGGGSAAALRVPRGPAGPSYYYYY